MNNALDDRRHNIPREAKPFHSTTSFRWSRKRAISFPATIWCLSKRMDYDIVENIKKYRRTTFKTGEEKNKTFQPT